MNGSAAAGLGGMWSAGACSRCFWARLASPNPQRLRIGAARPGKPVRQTAAASRRTPRERCRLMIGGCGRHRAKDLRRARHAVPLQMHATSHAWCAERREGPPERTDSTAAGELVLFRPRFGPKLSGETSGDDDDASVCSRGRLCGSADLGAGVCRSGDGSRAGRCGSGSEELAYGGACAARAAESD